MTKNTIINTLTTSFTPLFSFVTPGDLSVSYATQTGSYSIMGPAIYVVINLFFTPTFSTASGNIIITGFPFSSSGEFGFTTGNLNANITWPAGVTQMAPFISNATTTATLAGIGSAINRTSFTNSNVTSGVQTNISFSGFYFRSF